MGEPGTLDCVYAKRIRENHSYTNTHNLVDDFQVVMTAGQALQILLLVCNERHAMLLLQHLLQREREVHLRARDKGARVVAILDGIRQLINRCVFDDGLSK